MLQFAHVAGPVEGQQGGLRTGTEAQAALLAHDWPGNVRELEHLVGRSALKALTGLAKRPRIVSLTAAHLDLQPPPRAAAPAPAASEETAAAPALDLRTSMEAHQRQRIEASLARHHGNWASAARELGLHRANLVRLAKRLGLSARRGVDA
jgi:anaerobic nitric oxide reductase transcription regulator